MSLALAPSSSPVWDEDTIVFLNPDEPFMLKEVIGDILRTRFCVPGSIFLVEHIDHVVPVDRRYRTIRLLLGDGRISIQALFKGEAHGLIQNGQIQAGCYVRVDEFELRLIQLDEEPGDVPTDQIGDLAAATTKKRKREARKKALAYLLLQDLITVGWDNAYMEMLKTENPDARLEPTILAKVPEPSVKRPRLLQPKEDTEQRPSVTTTEKPPAQAPSLNLLNTNPDRAPEPDNPPVHIARPPVVQLAQQHAEKALPPAELASKFHVPPKASRRSWIPKDLTKPVKLTPLGSIRNLPYKANWAVNVLAVVTSLTEVTVSNLRPFDECTAHLADPSTGRTIALTVFQDPDSFTPAIGSVVLVLGVKNHLDGGLKKYHDPNETERWWYAEPTEYGWCDVTGLRSWWDSQQSGKSAQ